MFCACLTGCREDLTLPRVFYFFPAFSFSRALRSDMLKRGSPIPEPRNFTLSAFSSLANSAWFGTAFPLS